VWSPRYEEYWYIQLWDEFRFKQTDVIYQSTGRLDESGQEIYETEPIQRK
jgi:hypothetical protein